MPQAGVVGGHGLGAMSPLALGFFQPGDPVGLAWGAHGLVVGFSALGM